MGGSRSALIKFADQPRKAKMQTRKGVLLSLKFVEAEEEKIWMTNACTCSIHFDVCTQFGCMFNPMFKFSVSQQCTCNLWIAKCVDTMMVSKNFNFFCCKQQSGCIRQKRHNFKNPSSIQCCGTTTAWPMRRWHLSDTTSVTCEK